MKLHLFGIFLIKWNGHYRLFTRSALLENYIGVLTGKHNEKLAFLGREMASLLRSLDSAEDMLKRYNFVSPKQIGARIKSKK
jgi:hypothetical protein